MSFVQLQTLLQTGIHYPNKIEQELSHDIYSLQNISTLVGCLMDYSEECQLELRNYSSWEGIGKVLTERLAELTSLGEDGRHPLEDGRLQSLQVYIVYTETFIIFFFFFYSSHFHFNAFFRFHCNPCCDLSGLSGFLVEVGCLFWAIFVSVEFMSAAGAIDRVCF